MDKDLEAQLRNRVAEQERIREIARQGREQRRAERLQREAQRPARAISAKATSAAVRSDAYEISKLLVEVGASAVTAVRSETKTRWVERKGWFGITLAHQPERYEAKTDIKCWIITSGRSTYEVWPKVPERANSEDMATLRPTTHTYEGGICLSDTGYLWNYSVINSRVHLGSLVTDDQIMNEGLGMPDGSPNEEVITEWQQKLAAIQLR